MLTRICHLDQCRFFKCGASSSGRTPSICGGTRRNGRRSSFSSRRWMPIVPGVPACVQRGHHRKLHATSHQRALSRRQWLTRRCDRAFLQGFFFYVFELQFALLTALICLFSFFFTIILCYLHRWDNNPIFFYALYKAR